MDLMQKFLNIVVFPLVSLLTIIFFFPSLLLLRLTSYAKRSSSREDVAGKVVLVTGASSGIGEHVAYEYARRGARLAICARRENRLREVAEKSRQLGSPDVVAIALDVSKVEDCRRFVDEAVNHFGQVDHLVNNAGICPPGKFESCVSATDLAPIMDVNFWGSVNSTRFAIPHLRKSKGKIGVIASLAPWAIPPSLSVYNASKAAMITFFETLRVEFGSHIGITIATLGLIRSEITSSSFLAMTGMDLIPPRSTEKCAKAIVDSVCRGDRYLTEPSWGRLVFVLKRLCPELLEWLNRWVAIHRKRGRFNKQM